MRVTREKAAESRARIVETASRLFREKGFDGVGLDAIMKEAGLTHGGFYGHFTCKEDLAAEAVAHALEKSAELQRQHTNVDDFVCDHLSESHFADRANGCALVALAETWRAEAREFVPALRPTCALSWNGSPAYLRAPPPCGVGGPSPLSLELSAH